MSSEALAKDEVISLREIVSKDAVEKGAAASAIALAKAGWRRVRAKKSGARSLPHRS